METFDLFFMWSTNFFLLFTLLLMLSPFGRIRIGGKAASSDFSTLSWLAVLFAAGMGIGLLFWGVAEPTAYFTNWWGTPFNVEAYSPEAKSLAMGLLFSTGESTAGLSMRLSPCRWPFLPITKACHCLFALYFIRFSAIEPGAG